MRKHARKIVASKKRNLRGRSLMATKRTMKSRRYVRAAMDTDRIRDELTSLLENMRDYDFLEIWNEYCDRGYDEQGHIYFMNEFDEVYGDVESAFDLIKEYQRLFKRGYFNAEDTYFRFDGYGDTVSIDDIFIGKNSPVDMDELIDSIIDNDNDYGNNDIRDILDGDEDEDFEEE